MVDGSHETTGRAAPPFRVMPGVDAGRKPGPTTGAIGAVMEGAAGDSRAAYSEAGGRAQPSAAPGTEPRSSSGGARRLRIALAHDWICGYRGGEAVLERLAALVAREHEAAGLYVMFDDGRPLAPEVDRLRFVAGAARSGSGRGVFASPLNALPGGASAWRRWLLPAYPSAVRSLGKTLKRAHGKLPVDLVISTSSAAIKGLAPPDGVPHLCYCHSPARYVWSRQADYEAGESEGFKGRLRAAGLRKFGEWFRNWDKATAANVTRFIANSGHTAAEIRRCYGRDAAVVHPPVRTEYFAPDKSVKRRHFWLVVSALEPYKRVDLAIAAAKKAGKELVVAGAGSQRRALERLAGPAAHFLGRVDDDRLRQLYRTAGVLIFPQVEDFGITAAEAQACGLPVVARGAGGALDIVVDGATGAFFGDDTTTDDSNADIDRLIAASARAATCCGSTCRENAERFSEAAFDARMRAVIDELLSSFAVRGAAAASS